MALLLASYESQADKSSAPIKEQQFVCLFVCFNINFVLAMCYLSAFGKHCVEHYGLSKPIFIRSCH